MKRPVVYIITNFHNTTLYIGVTSDLGKRMYQHKDKLVKGFSCKYKLTKLVYYEKFECIENAIMREKRLKRWRRQWKNRIISSFNPDWLDLSQRML